MDFHNISIWLAWRAFLSWLLIKNGNMLSYLVILQW